MSHDMSAAIRAELASIEAQAEALATPITAAQPHGDEGAPAGGFADSLREALHGVNEQDRRAGEKMADVDSGRSDDLVGAMLASQEASLSFSMLMQVRNKVMGAMDELIKLPL